MPMNSAILVGRVAPRLSHTLIGGRRRTYAAFEFEGVPGKRERLPLVAGGGDPLPLGHDVLLNASLRPFADGLALFVRTVTILDDGAVVLPHARRGPMEEQDVSGYERRLRDGRVIKVKGYTRGGKSSAKAKANRR